MIIAHLPAGYVVSKLSYRRFRSCMVSWKMFCLAAILGAMVPDLDMLYFHLADQRRHHHHTYFTHYPVTWLALLAISTIWLWSARQKRAASLATIFSFNA